MQSIIEFIRVRATQQTTWIGIISLICVGLRIGLDEGAITQAADAILLLIGAGAVARNG